MDDLLSANAPHPDLLHKPARIFHRCSHHLHRTPGVVRFHNPTSILELSLDIAEGPTVNLASPDNPKGLEQLHLQIPLAGIVNLWARDLESATSGGMGGGAKVWLLSFQDQSREGFVQRSLEFESEVGRDSWLFGLKKVG